MEAEFWQRKWESNDIGFHNHQANPLLVKHLEQLALPSGSRLFVPLCGKTLDIGWLLAKGYKVAGAELSKLAVTQLFDELGITPQISQRVNWKSTVQITWLFLLVISLNFANRF